MKDLTGIACFVALPLNLLDMLVNMKRPLVIGLAAQNLGDLLACRFSKSESMGNIPFCDCLDVRKGSVDVKFEALEKQRIEAVGKLFELTDLNGDGLITAQEFALMGLCKTKAHTEKTMMPHEEQAIKGLFIEKFAEEIDMSLKPMNFRKYKEYICRSVNNMDPGDMEVLKGLF